MITDLRSLTPGRIALYGFGAVGKFVLSELMKERPDIIITCIIDDGQAGDSHNSISIYTAVQVMNIKDSFDLILVTGFAWRKMTDRLDALGLDNYEVVDILRGPAPTENVLVQKNGFTIDLATPNRLSAIVGKRFFEIEPDTISWINSFSLGACFYDIGASNGMFSLYSAIARDCKVVAFEPDGLNFGLMCKNRILNQSRLSQSFIALQVAVSDGPGLIELVSPDLPYEGAHGKFTSSDLRPGNIDKGIQYTQPCLSDSLSDLIERHNLPKPDYLKVDVDGAEFSVLEGMLSILESGCIKELLVETENVNADQLVALMKKCGYILLANHPIEEMVGGAVEGVSNYLFGSNV